MTKRRQPLTFADAVTRVVGHLTYSEAARISGRSERLVYTWTAPDNAASPSLDQALALEAAYRATGGDGAPILEAYGFLLNVTTVAQSSSQRAFSSDIASMARECGEAIASGIMLTGPGAAPAQVHHAMVEAEQARSAIGSFIGRLKGFLPQANGTSGESNGGATT